MSGYINSTNNLNEADFLSLFKKLYHFIKDKIYPKPTEELTLEELVEIYSNDKNFLNRLEYIKTLLDDTADLMRNLNFPHDEYYNFMSINNMITYIVSDVKKYIKHSLFVLSLLNDFNNLIDNINNKEYDIIYEEFDINLDKHEDYFYTEIFDSTHDYDELIVKVTNILE